MVVSSIYPGSESVYVRFNRFWKFKKVLDVHKCEPLTLLIELRIGKCELLKPVTTYFYNSFLDIR